MEMKMKVVSFYISFFSCLGFLTFEPLRLGIFRKVDCLSCLCGLPVALLMAPAVYCGRVTVQDCDLAAAIS